MATRAAPEKVECLNPNTGGTMNIDKKTYELFSKAILHTLEKSPPLTFTQVVAGIRNRFRQQKTEFPGSVEWYAVTVKHDMHARGIIEVFTEKAKKFHRLKQQN